MPAASITPTGADHPPAAVEQERLDHAGVGDLPGNGDRVGGGRHTPVGGHGHATGREGLAHHELVAGGEGGCGVVVGKAEGGTGAGGNQRALVIDGKDGRDRVGLGVGDDALDCTVRFGQVDAKRVRGRGGDAWWCVDGPDEGNPAGFGGAGEGPGAVGGGVHDEEDGGRRGHDRGLLAFFGRERFEGGFELRHRFGTIGPRPGCPLLIAGRLLPGRKNRGGGLQEAADVSGREAMAAEGEIEIIRVGVLDHAVLPASGHGAG
jgi:hypothetical protein